MNGVLQVSSVIGGIITGVNVNDGGRNYTLNNVLSVSSDNSTTNGSLSVSKINDGFITGVIITNHGNGYSANESLSVSSSNTNNNVTLPTMSVNTIQELSVESSIVSLNTSLNA